MKYNINIKKWDETNSPDVSSSNLSNSFHINTLQLLALVK